MEKKTKKHLWDMIEEKEDNDGYQLNTDIINSLDKKEKKNIMKEIGYLSYSIIGKSEKKIGHKNFKKKIRKIISKFFKNKKLSDETTFKNIAKLIGFAQNKENVKQLRAIEKKQDNKSLKITKPLTTIVKEIDNECKQFDSKDSKYRKNETEQLEYIHNKYLNELNYNNSSSNDNNIEKKNLFNKPFATQSIEISKYNEKDYDEFYPNFKEDLEQQKYRILQPMNELNEFINKSFDNSYDYNISKKQFFHKESLVNPIAEITNNNKEDLKLKQPDTLSVSEKQPNNNKEDLKLQKQKIGFGIDNYTTAKEYRQNQEFIKEIKRQNEKCNCKIGDDSLNKLQQEKDKYKEQQEYKKRQESNEELGRRYQNFFKKRREQEEMEEIKYQKAKEITDLYDRKQEKYREQERLVNNLILNENLDRIHKNKLRREIEEMERENIKYQEIQEINNRYEYEQEKREFEKKQRKQLGNSLLYNNTLKDGKEFINPIQIWENSNQKYNPPMQQQSLYDLNYTKMNNNADKINYHYHNRNTPRNFSSSLPIIQENTNNYDENYHIENNKSNRYLTVFSEEQPIIQKRLNNYYEKEQIFIKNTNKININRQKIDDRWTTSNAEYGKDCHIENNKNLISGMNNIKEQYNNNRNINRYGSPESYSSLQTSNNPYPKYRIIKQNDNYERSFHRYNKNIHPEDYKVKGNRLFYMPNIPQDKKEQYEQFKQYNPSNYDDKQPEF